MCLVEQSSCYWPGVLPQPQACQFVGAALHGQLDCGSRVGGGRSSLPCLCCRPGFLGWHPPLQLHLCTCFVWLTLGLPECMRRRGCRAIVRTHYPAHVCGFVICHKATTWSTSTQLMVESHARPIRLHGGLRSQTAAVIVHARFARRRSGTASHD